jgi:peptide/nickel transport system substrate-binding protein
VLEDRAGRPIRFALITQKGNTALERGASVIRDSLAKVGIAVDVVALEVGALIDRLQRGDYDAIYFRFLMSDTDPAMQMDFWLSSGGAHVWNIGQKAPATIWEGRVDMLMQQQVATFDQAERKQIFQEVQQIFADQLPILYFAAPRVTVATSARLLPQTPPAPLRPMVLWSADTLTVAPK